MRMDTFLCDEDDAVTCGNCHWTGTGNDLLAIQHFEQRVAAGEICPAGECPKCGALAYVAAS